MDCYEWLRRLCEADAPSEAALLAADYFSSFAEVERDVFGGVTALLRAGEKKPTLMLDAHIDTIGMIVTAIDNNGFLKVGQCGRMDARVLTGAEVTVWGKEPVYGVVCSTPPHLSRGEKNGVPSVDEISIDIGFSGERARQKITPGDRVTLVQTCKPLLGALACGKSLDNRAGVVALMVAGELLQKEKELPCNVVFSLSEQEETGGSPSASACFRLRPQEAVVVDVSFATAYHTPAEVEAELGKGPMLGIAANLSREMFSRMRQVAETAGVAVQTEVMSGRTGTNADRMVGTAEGLPCALVSIPLRNMHTAAEVVCLSDIEQTGRLLAEYAKGGLCHG